MEVARGILWRPATRAHGDRLADGVGTRRLACARVRARDERVRGRSSLRAGRAWRLAAEPGSADGGGCASACAGGDGECRQGSEQGAGDDDHDAGPESGVEFGSDVRLRCLAWRRLLAERVGVHEATALQLPSFGSHSSVCSPGPLRRRPRSPGRRGVTPVRRQRGSSTPGSSRCPSRWSARRRSITHRRRWPWRFRRRHGRGIALAADADPAEDGSRARSQPPKSTSALSETTEGPRISAATAEGAGVLAAREGLVRDRDTGDCSSVDCITRGPAVVSDTRHRRTRLVGGVVVVARWRRGDSCARRRGGCPGRGTRGCRRGLEHSATASWVLAWSRRARARRRLEPARPSPSLARRGGSCSVGHTGWRYWSVGVAGVGWRGRSPGGRVRSSPLCAGPRMPNNGRLVFR